MKLHRLDTLAKGWQYRVTMRFPSMPYFDILFDKFAKGDEKYLEAYGKHVHWGYWPDPSAVSTSAESYARAEDALSRLVYEGAQVINGMSVLDVGCGFGGTINMMNDAFSDVRLTGLNIDPRQLVRARAWVTARPGNSVDFIEGNACRLPFKDGTMDAVTAVECIFHFPSRLRFLKEARRVLKPGHWLSISDFVPPAWAFPILGLYALFVSRRVKKVYGDSNGIVTTTLYRILAKLAGFSRIEIIDITANTLPTFTAVNALTLPTDPLDQTLKKAIRPLEIISRKGMLRYMVLRFQK